MNPYNYSQKPIMQNFPYNWAFCFTPFPPVSHSQYNYPTFQNSNQFFNNANLTPCLSQPQNTPIVEFQRPIKAQENHQDKLQSQQHEKVYKSLRRPYHLIESEKRAKKAFNYIHQKPSVTYIAQYYDPSAAPSLTSNLYNTIGQSSLDEDNIKKMKTAASQFLNQLQFPEEDDDPFIVFKYRRIKKKYRRYLRNTNMSCLTHNQIDSISDSDVDSEIDDLKMNQEAFIGIEMNNKVQIGKNQEHIVALVNPTVQYKNKPQGQQQREDF